MNLSYRVFYVFFRNLISYKRFVLTTLVVSLGQPLFYLFAFGIGMGAYMGSFGGKPYLNYIVPGVIISSATMSSTFECLYYTFVKLVHQKLYDSLIVTPVSAEDAVAGDILWGTFRGFVSGSLMMLIAMGMGVLPHSFLDGLILLGFIVFIGVLFSSLAMIVTSFAPNFDFFNYYTELVITPMLFFSGVFFPLDQFPHWMQVFANFLPLTHAVILSRTAYTGGYSPSLLLNLLVLLMIELVAFVIGIKLMKKRLVK